MKILTRQVVVPKSVEETTQILKSAAYYFPKAMFAQSGFSMHCAKRNNRGDLSLISVRGTVSEAEDHTEVILEMHADLYFFLGCAIALLGIIGLFYCLISHSDRWIPCLGMILLGLLVSGQSLWEGSALLDRLEHKLVR